MVLEAKIPDMSIKAKRPPISPPFNLSKFDLINSIDKKTIVAFREEIFEHFAPWRAKFGIHMEFTPVIRCQNVVDYHKDLFKTLGSVSYTHLTLPTI